MRRLPTRGRITSNGVEPTKSSPVELRVGHGFIHANGTFSIITKLTEEAVIFSDGRAIQRWIFEDLCGLGHYRFTESRPYIATMREVSTGELNPMPFTAWGKTESEALEYANALQPGCLEVVSVAPDGWLP